MNPEQARKIADQLVGEAEEKRNFKLSRVPRRKMALERLQTGLATVVGSGFGYSISQALFDNALWHIVCAVVVGLLAAVALPPKPQV